jgi:hypothetical protein
MIRSVFLVAAGLVLLGLSQLASAAEKEIAKAGPATPATYVGNEVCQACHAAAFEKFSTTVMGKIFLHNPRNETEKRACENCHGPGSNHVAAGGGRASAA